MATLWHPSIPADTEETCGQGWQPYLLYVNGVLTTTQLQQARSLSTNIASKEERKILNK